MQALYTDNTPVVEGDRIRAKQQPGGLLPPGGWREGIAVPFPNHVENAEAVSGAGMDPFELHLFDGKGYMHIAPHIIERLPLQQNTR